MKWTVQRVVTPGQVGESEKSRRQRRHEQAQGGEGEGSWSRVVEFPIDAQRSSVATVSKPTATFDEYQRSARSAVRCSKWADAWEQAAAAVAIKPISPESDALFELLLSKSPDPLPMLPFNDDSFFGVAALRARVLACRKQWDEALEILVTVVLAQPAAPYLVWAKDWQPSPLTVLELAQRVEQAANSETWQACVHPANINALVDLLTVNATLSDPQQVLASTTRIRLRSRVVGARSSAAQARDEAHSAGRWPLWAAYAAAMRDWSEWHHAAEGFERAIEICPTETLLHLDLADVRLRLGEFQRADTSYARVLALDPRNDWARSSSAYCRAQQGDESQRQWLRVYAQANPGNDRARRLAHHLSVDDTSLPLPLSPVLDTLRRAVLSASRSADDVVHVYIPDSQTVPASLARAFIDALAQIGKVGRLIRSENGQLVMPVRPSSSVDPRDAVVAAKIAELANSAIQREEWTRQAKTMCPRDGAETEALVRLLHAPPPQTRLHPFDWTFRVQVCVACALGWSGVTESEWPQPLLDLLNNTDEWITCAGAVGLSWLARDDSAPQAFRETAALKLQSCFARTTAEQTGLRYVCSVILFGMVADEEVVRELWDTRLALETEFGVVRP